VTKVQDTACFEVLRFPIIRWINKAGISNFQTLDKTRWRAPQKRSKTIVE